jgi:HEAT repeat protein
MDHLKDSDEMTRYWTVEGMALLGSDNTIRPLLDVFRSDPSAKVRERAACSLAQSGMLTKDQRMNAAPEIIAFLDDASVDATTRNWAYQALRDITGANVGSDPGAWRAWMADHRTR